VMVRDSSRRTREIDWVALARFVLGLSSRKVGRSCLPKNRTTRVLPNPDNSSAYDTMEPEVLILFPDLG
jgi:hypothetical protein